MTTVIATRTVVLHPAAVRDVSHEALRAGGVRETGGWLFGHAGRDGRITIAAACATSPNAPRDPGYVGRSLAHGQRHARLRATPIIGGWHSHVDIEATYLSDEDRRTCTTHLEMLRDDYGDDAM